MDTPRIARPVKRLASFVLGSLLCGGAWAGTATVTASVAVDTFCTVSTAALNFTPYDPIVAHRTSDLNGTASVSVTCVKGTSPAIALGLGTHANSSTRRMQHATHTSQLLTYELYQPPNTAAGTACSFPASVIWGSSGINLFSPGAAPNKNSRTFNVCGTVPAGQDVEVGSYSDTVVVTVSF